MTLSRNVLASLASSIWSATLSLAAVPLYLKYLGIENFGIIGFFAAAQGLIQLLDLGLTPTINRELARYSATGELPKARNLLHTLAVTYWVTAIIIVAGISAVAPVIANFWLHSRDIPTQTLKRAVMLIGLVIACQWPIALYQGALIGMQRLTISSAINIAMVTVGVSGAIGILAWISPTIEAFFIWQAVIALVHVAIMRRAAWQTIGESIEAKFHFSELRRIWRFSAGMTGIAVSAAVLTQLDKVLLSRMLSLEDFGRYSLAWLIGSGLYVLLAPVFNVIYPRMSQLVTLERIPQLLDMYKSGTRLLSAVLFPVTLAAALFSEDLVFLWTGNRTLATTVAPIAAPLLLGTALNGVMNFPFALQLAYGRMALPISITCTLAVTLVPLIIILVKLYGALGGALAWLAVNVVNLFFGTWMTHRSLLRGRALGWLINDIGLPLGLSLLVMLLGWRITYIEGDYIANLLTGFGLLSIALLLNLLALPKLLIQKLLDLNIGIH